MFLRVAGKKVSALEMFLRFAGKKVSALEMFLCAARGNVPACHRLTPALTRPLR